MGIQDAPELIRIDLEKIGAGLTFPNMNRDKIEYCVKSSFEEWGSRTLEDTIQMDLDIAEMRLTSPDIE